MFDRIAPRYDVMNRLISLGLDGRWRRRAIAGLELAPNGLIADIGCGTGDFTIALTRDGYRTIGVDLSFAMLNAAPQGVGALIQGDGSTLPFASKSIDGVVSGFTLRNFADIEAVFAEFARVIRPGGRLSVLEVDIPRARLLQVGHRIWFGAVVPVLGALLSDKSAYRYLPDSVAYLPPESSLLAMIESAGFVDVEKRSPHGGIVQILTATRAGAFGIAAQASKRRVTASNTRAVS